MSLRKYRAIDLIILTLISCGLEGIIIFGLHTMAAEFVVSVTTILLLIAIVRWNYFGLIVGLIGGIFSAWFTVTLSGENQYMLQMLVVYGLGNLFIITEFLFFKLIGKKNLYAGNWFLVLYAIIGYFSVCLGRTIISLFFGNPFLIYLKQQMLAEILNLVFALIILFITNKQDSVLRDQKDYFLEVSVGGNDER